MSRMCASPHLQEERNLEVDAIISSKQSPMLSPQLFCNSPYSSSVPDKDSPLCWTLKALPLGAGFPPSYFVLML